MKEKTKYEESVFQISKTCIDCGYAIIPSWWYMSVLGWRFPPEDKDCCPKCGGDLIYSKGKFFWEKTIRTFLGIKISTRFRMNRFEYRSKQRFDIWNYFHEVGEVIGGKKK